MKEITVVGKAQMQSRLEQMKVVGAIAGILAGRLTPGAFGVKLYANP
jgi:hypothetical protein